METSMTTAVGGLLERLPEKGAERELTLRRLTEACASAEAASALQNAARRARETSAGPLADLLSAAAAAWDGGTLPFRATGKPWSEDMIMAGARPALDPLRRALASPALGTLLPAWVAELRRIADANPRTGACTLASALELWAWTLAHFRAAADVREPALLELAEAFGGLAAARCQVLDVAGAPATTFSVERDFRTDLCHVQAARVAGAVGALCAELVFGFRRHPAWDAEGCASCYGGDEVDMLEAVMPGIASAARAASDVVESDGSHAPKAGPCARFEGVETFRSLRARLDGCLTGARLSMERAAAALPQVMAAAPAR